MNIHRPKHQQRAPRVDIKYSKRPTKWLAMRNHTPSGLEMHPRVYVNSKERQFGRADMNEISYVFHQH
jgi:hypothetical protein